MLDLFGKAILDYQIKNKSENLITETSISEADEMDISYLFRTYNEMPKIEQLALDLTKGKTLDVGCGAGSHSLFLQNERKIIVKAIDISENAIKTCKLRGLEQALCQDVLTINSEKFDTILLLMNGTGIFKKKEMSIDYLIHLKKLLAENGQILIDSSDIKYMYTKTELKKMTKENKYYGEIEFTITYKNKTGIPFPWLYLDCNTFKKLSEKVGFKFEVVQKGTHFDYLAKLSI